MNSKIYTLEFWARPYQAGRATALDAGLNHEKDVMAALKKLRAERNKSICETKNQ